MWVPHALSSQITMSKPHLSPPLCPGPWHGHALTQQGLDLPSIASHKWAIHSCSAVTGAGLEGGMDWTIKEVAGRLYWNAPVESSSTNTRPPPPPTGSIQPNPAQVAT